MNMSSNPLGHSPIIPVVSINKLEDALPLANALLEGGIAVIEITLRTKCALEAIEILANKLPEIRVGAGTIVSCEQVQQCRDHGANFGLSPGVSVAVLEAASNLNWPFVPGVATASEMMLAMSLGYTIQKFFPAEINGGASALKGFSGPFPELQFCPTGGVSPANLKSYLALRNVCCVGGTWLTPSHLIEQKQWHAITALCREGLAQKEI